MLLLQQADGCGEDCLNRHSYIHCDAKLCPAGAACSNRPFHQLRPPPMEVCTGVWQRAGLCGPSAKYAACLGSCRSRGPLPVSGLQKFRF